MGNKIDKSKLIICRCNEITLADIEAAIAKGEHSINEIKKRTTAGMGICQGRTCSRLITNIIREKTGLGGKNVRQNTARPPVRPLPIDALGEGEK